MISIICAMLKIGVHSPCQDEGLMARTALCSVLYLCLWTSRMQGDTLCRRPSGSAHSMAHLLWKGLVENLCRMLIHVFHSALAHLWTRLLGILLHFVPAMGTTLCSVPPFPVMRTGTVESLEGVSFLSLDMWPGSLWGSLKEKEESPNKELTWDDAAEEAVKDFGEDIKEHPSSYLEKGSVCLGTVDNETSLAPEGVLEGNIDTEWSDDDDDDNDEAKDEVLELNAELWNSFLRSDDPYNPFNFSCPAGRRENNAGNEKDKQTGMLQGHPPVKDVRTCQDQKQGLKKVRFSDAVKVHPLVVWQFASRDARDGSCWLEMARDRERFRRRVQAAGDVISPCLLPQHRARVWHRLHS